MYKPNGEEPMTKHEEMRRREAIAERNSQRLGEEPTVETLRSAFYAAIFKATALREDRIGALVGER